MPGIDLKKKRKKKEPNGVITIQLDWDLSVDLIIKGIAEWQ